MPITKAGLSSAIKAKMVEKKGAPADAAALQDFCDILGEAIVDYLKANALVTLAPTTAVTSGAGAGGLVAGTGTIS